MKAKTVTYVSLERAEAVRDPVVMVNLLAPGEGSPYYWLENHAFIAASIKSEEKGYDTEGIKSLVIALEAVHKEHPDKGIVVHCKYGQVRSSTVALFIAEKFNYELNERVYGCKPKNKCIDRQLLSYLHEYHAKHLETATQTKKD